MISRDFFFSCNHADNRSHADRIQRQSFIPQRELLSWQANRQQWFVWSWDCPVTSAITSTRLTEQNLLNADLLSGNHCKEFLRHQFIAACKVAWIALFVDSYIKKCVWITRDFAWIRREFRVITRDFWLQLDETFFSRVIHRKTRIDSRLIPAKSRVITRNSRL